MGTASLVLVVADARKGFGRGRSVWTRPLVTDFLPAPGDTVDIGPVGMSPEVPLPVASRQWHPDGTVSVLLARFVVDPTAAGNTAPWVTSSGGEPDVFLRSAGWEPLR